MPKWHPIWGRATGSACARCFWIHRGAGTWDMTRAGSCCGPHQRPLWPGLAVLIWNWSTPYEQELQLQTTSGSASAAQGVPRHTYPTSCSIAGQKFHMLRDRRNGRIFLGLEWSIHHGESQHWAEPNSCCLGSQSLWTSLSITQGIWPSWDCHVFQSSLPRIMQQCRLMADHISRQDTAVPWTRSCTVWAFVSCSFCNLAW